MDGTEREDGGIRPAADQQSARDAEFRGSPKRPGFLASLSASGALHALLFLFLAWTSWNIFGGQGERHGDTIVSLAPRPVAPPEPPPEPNEPLALPKLADTPGEPVIQDLPPPPPEEDEVHFTESVDTLPETFASLPLDSIVPQPSNDPQVQQPPEAEPQPRPSEQSTDTGTGDSPPILQEGVAPAYPAAALRLRWRGTVQLILVIDEAGRVRSAQVKHSSGHAVLDEAALAAVRGWRYSPALRAGQPVAITVNKSITFRF